MITPAQISNKYRSVQPYLELVRARVRDSLLVHCEEHGFALVSRIKTLESASEKVETGRFGSWAEIDDLVAITVIVPTLAHEPIVVAFLQASFDQIDLRPKGSTRKAPDVFRFDSTRFIGRLRSPDDGSRGPMHEVPFEVQVRSAFEHAWSVTTHALTYKSADVSWSKIRLTSQLKAAVEQLDTLILSFDDSAKYIQPSAWPEIEAKAALRIFFDNVVRSGRVPVELAPKDWSRFVDNVFGLVAKRGNRSAGEIVTAIERDFQAELAVIGPGNVPLSISLWQLTFASLFKGGSVTPSLKGHWPLITPELEDLYPSLRGFNPRFDCS